MGPTDILLDGESLTPYDVVSVVRGGATVSLDPAARARVEATARAVQQAVAWRPVYGATTGVGANRDVVAERAGHGQRILLSHATAGGDPLPDEVARAVLVVRANQLAAGGSGARAELLDGLITAIGLGAAPLLHGYTGIGTGDLSALAELGLQLAGELPWRSGAPPVVPLTDLDVLPFLSSTAATVAQAIVAAVDLAELLTATYPVTALSFVALGGNPEAFDARVHEARPQHGQAEAAKAIRDLLAGGRPTTPLRIQDPFGLRSFPQVHGPAVHALDRLLDVLTIELNSRAENPLVVRTEAGGDVLHHGNWHGAPVALALDSARLALHSVASLSVARTASLMNPDLTALTSFLAEGPAGSSGAMGVEYVQHAALARLRSLAAPASLSTARMSRGAEDHASFSTEAARLTLESVVPFRTVLACELVTASRALRLAGVKPADLLPSGVGEAYQRAYDELPPDLGDRPLTIDIAKAETLLIDG